MKKINNLDIHIVSYLLTHFTNIFQTVSLDSDW